MNERIYRDLLQDIGQYFRLDDPIRFASSGFLKLEGMPVLLVYDEAFDPQILQIRFDLGTSPDEGREALWYALLESNFIWGEGGRFVFGVCSENGHVVLTMQHAIATGTRAVELGDWLRAAAQEVKARWSEIPHTQIPEARPEGGRPAWPHRQPGGWAR